MLALTRERKTPAQGCTSCRALIDQHAQSSGQRIDLRVFSPVPDAEYAFQRDPRAVLAVAEISPYHAWMRCRPAS